MSLPKPAGDPFEGNKANVEKRAGCDELRVSAVFPNKVEFQLLNDNTWRRTVKTFLTVITLATLMVSPALASAVPHRALFSSGPSATPWDAVIVEGKIVGQDPDANVRLDLRRDAYGADRD